MEVTNSEKEGATVKKKSLLVTTNERELAKSRAQILKMFKEMEQVKAEADLARREAHELREHIISSSTKKSRFNFRNLAAVVTVVMMVAAIAKTIYLGYTLPPDAGDPVAATASPHSRSAAQLTARATPSPKPSLAANPPASQTRPGRGSGSAQDAEFNKAVSRLQEAFSSLPETQAEIVSEINEKHPGGCPLAWNNGEVALYVTPPDSGHLSLVSALNRCAEGAEQLFTDREAALRAMEAKADSQ